MCNFAAGSIGMIRIDEIWLATEPLAGPPVMTLIQSAELNGHDAYTLIWRMY